MKACSWILGIFVYAQAFGCTNFVVESLDGGLVNGRSMEFAIELDTQLAFHPRGEKNTSISPSSAKEGLSWVSKYGFVSLVGLGLDFAIDGLNEKGLSIGFLWLPGTEYQTVPEGKESQSLALEYVGNWLLGNFETVDDVRESLKDVYVWAHPLDALKGEIPPLHITIHDRKGKSLVVEFIGGEKKIYDNPNTVLTNAPQFEWHITNLSNYVNLTEFNSKPQDISGITVAPFGQGSGLLGLPGDLTPPSRFTRVTFLRHFSEPPKTSDEAVNLALHLLNTVDIPLGVVRKDDNSIDYTQWIVIKDLTRNRIYFRTYNNLNLLQVDFSDLNFDQGRPIKKASIEIKEPPKNVTSILK